MVEKQNSKPTPTESRPGKQRDDNLDDMGRRPDGSEQDQPVDAGEKDRKGRKD